MTSYADIDDDALCHIFWSGLHLALGKGARSRFRDMKQLGLTDRKHARLWRDTLSSFVRVEPTIAICGHSTSRHGKTRHYVFLVKNPEKRKCPACRCVSR